MSEVLIPTPNPWPEETEITPAEHRRRNVNAALRRVVAARYELAFAELALKDLKVTEQETTNSLANWIVQ